MSMISEKYPNIKAEYIPKPTGGGNEEYHDKLVTMLAAGDGSIDIMNVDVVWPAELVGAKWLLPLDDVFLSSEQEKYVDAYIDAFTFDGKIYGFPNQYDAGMFFYRTDILKDGGVQVPKLWSEMANAAQKLQTNDQYGFVAAFDISGHLYCNYLEFVWSNNGEWLENVTKVRIEEPQSLQAVNFMLDLMNKYKVTQPGITSMALDDGRRLFTGGKGVFHRNWTYVYGLGERDPESKVKGKIGVTELPHFDGGESASALGGWAWTVNKFSKHPEEAKLVAKFLASHEVQLLRTDADGTRPAIKSVFTDPEVLKSYPEFKEIGRISDTSRARAQTPFYTELSDLFTIELHNILVGKKTVKQGLADAADAMREVLE
jgi:multiple sugar transport system substrate-binding protein